MKLTIKFNDKSSQVINMSEKALMRNEKSKKSPQEIHEMCKDIAFDLDHNHESIHIDND